MISDKSRSPEFSSGSADRADEELVLVLTTWPAGTSFDNLADALVADRLAACVSILPPHRSVYLWQGAIEHAEEQQVLLKSTRARLSALSQAVHAAHPYDVPEWIVLNVSEVSEAYGRWMLMLDA